LQRTKIHSARFPSLISRSSEEDWLQSNHKICRTLNISRLASNSPTTNSDKTQYLEVGRKIRRSLTLHYINLDNLSIDPKGILILEKRNSNGWTK